MLPEPARRLEVRSTPSSLIFRAALASSGVLVRFELKRGVVTSCELGTKAGRKRVPIPEESHDLTALWNRTQWVTGVVMRTLWSSYTPSESERHWAEVFLCLDTAPRRLVGIAPILDAFERSDWPDALRLAENQTGIKWFEPFRLGLCGKSEEIFAHAEHSQPVDGHLASFRGIARRELYLFDAAYEDLRAGSAKLTAPERAMHFTMMAEICGQRDQPEEAVRLLAWALPYSANDEEIIRSAELIMRFDGGYGPVESALERRTNRGAAPPEVWLLRAKLALWCGRTDEARELLPHATTGDHRPTLCLAIADALDGNDEAALERLFTIAHVEDREAHAWSAELLKRAGNDALALEHLETSRVTSQTPVHTLLHCVVDGTMNISGRAHLASEHGLTARSEQTVEAAAQALRVFQGNRGPEPSRTPTSAPVSSAYELAAATVPPPTDMQHTSRLDAGNLVKQVRHRPLAEIHRDFETLAEVFPESPHPYCYRGEILLWEGRYDEALAAFNGNRAAKIARWGFVGRAAVHVHRLDFEAALAEFAHMTECYDPVRGATTHVYLGELYRIRGEYERALHELQIAIRAKPNRIGAKVNMVLAWAALGDEARAAAEFTTISQRWPNVFWHAARAVGLEGTLGEEALVETCEQSLVLMRGNRSSHLHTFYDLAGQMRFTVNAEALRAHFETTRSHLRIGALEQLLLGQPDATVRV